MTTVASYQDRYCGSLRFNNVKCDTLDIRNTSKLEMNACEVMSLSSIDKCNVNLDIDANDRLTLQACNGIIRNTKYLNLSYCNLQLRSCTSIKSINSCTLQVYYCSTDSGVPARYSSITGRGFTIYGNPTCYYTSFVGHNFNLYTTATNCTFKLNNSTLPDTMIRCVVNSSNGNGSFEATDSTLQISNHGGTLTLADCNGSIGNTSTINMSTSSMNLNQCSTVNATDSTIQTTTCGTVNLTSSHCLDTKSTSVTGTGFVNATLTASVSVNSYIWAKTTGLLEIKNAAGSEGSIGLKITSTTGDVVINGLSKTYANGIPHPP